VLAILVVWLAVFPWYDLVIAILGMPFAAFLAWFPHHLGHLLDKWDDHRVHNGKDHSHERKEFER
jgi:hypothetical protein